MMPYRKNTEKINSILEENNKLTKSQILKEYNDEIEEERKQEIRLKMFESEEMIPFAKKYRFLHYKTGFVVYGGYSTKYTNEFIVKGIFEYYNEGKMIIYLEPFDVWYENLKD